MHFGGKRVTEIENEAVISAEIKVHRDYGQIIKEMSLENERLRGTIVMQQETIESLEEECKDQDAALEDREVWIERLTTENNRLKSGVAESGDE